MPTPSPRSSLPRLLPDNKRVREGALSHNTGGYSRARTRLSPAAIECAFQSISQQMIDATKPSFHGRRVFLLDGTTIPLASTPALKRAYPPATNQHGASDWPTALLVVAHELESGCALAPEIGPKYGASAVSELSLAEALIPRLPAGSVVLADRNFGVFSLVHTAVQNGQDVVIRLQAARFQALVRRAAPVPGTRS